MKRLHARAAALLSAFGFSVACSTALAQKYAAETPDAVLTPDVVETQRLGTLRFFDGMPDEDSVRKAYDNLDFMHGVEAFLNCVPGASAEGFRTGWATQGADNNQAMIIMENLMDSKSLYLTPNTESIYHMAWLDTSDGPLVLETPPNVLGIIDNHWFKYVGDFGNAGPDKGKGGKYLLLPPGYDGEVPEGYFVLRSSTYGNLMFYRGFLENGSTEASLANTRKYYKAYSMKDADNPPPMEFIQETTSTESSTMAATKGRVLNESRPISASSSIPCCVTDRRPEYIR
mgnify:CR=1 FL=1